MESFFSLSILNGLTVLLPLITLPYILRIVGTSNYGVYSYVYVIIQYLLIINAYGFNYSATKQIAQNRENKEYINTIYNSVIACRLLLMIGATALFYALSPLLLATTAQKWMFFIGLGVVLGDIFNPVWLFQGLEKMRYMTIINIVSKTVFTILIFWIIRTPDDYVYIILFNSCGFLLSGICSTIIAKRQFKIRFFIPSRNDITFQFKEGFALFGSSIGINLYKNANIFILNFFVGSSAVGIYAAAEKVIKGLQLLGSPISQALFPHLGHSFKNLSVKESINLLKKAIKPLFFILFSASILTCVFAKPLVTIICGEGYEEAITLIRIMSPIILIGGMNSMLGLVGLVNLNHQKTFFFALLVSGIVNVAFLLSTASNWGILAGSWSVTLSEVVLLVIIMIKIRAINKQNR